MKPKVIKPAGLEKGSTIGIVATGNSILRAGPESVQRGYSRLREMGLNIVEAPNLRTQYGHAAGTIQERVNALHGFFEDPKIDAIMAYWGGFQSHQLLEHLD